jgi:hypothetical protein
MLSTSLERKVRCWWRKRACAAMCDSRSRYMAIMAPNHSESICSNDGT